MSRAQGATRQVTILGSTGSIGINTLDVIARHAQYGVFALSAHSNDRILHDQCLRFAPVYAVMVDPAAAERLRSSLRASGSATEVLDGSEALETVACDPRVDTVMAAIVGAAGLLPTLAAVRGSKKVLLANKEALIMAGELFMATLAESDATILPIDSEHNAVFQCLPPDAALPGSAVSGTVRRVVLTASGGPFLDRSLESLRDVTPDEACKHPNWDMGRKISVDSATMMNKGLELIEACYLFGVGPDRVDVLIHPQSIVHSMVEYCDGSVIAQMGSPDMRVPIASGLAWPARIESGADFLDLVASEDLQFRTPDLERFPCLALGMEAARSGSGAAVVLNAANEVAVAAFLEGRLRFMDIPVIIEDCMSRMTCGQPASLEMIQQADREARCLADELVASLRRSFSSPV